MALFGQLALCAAAVLSAAGAAVYLARGEEQRFHEAGRALLLAAAAAGAAALVVLAFLLVTHDTSVAYVHSYADRTMSPGLLLAAVWGGQQGSLTFWAVLQTWFTAAAAVWLGRRDLGTAPVSMALLGLMQLFFLLLVLFHSDPFAPLGTTASHGVGLNPLLRNPYMAWHPPTLFIGFVGFSVPLAFALGALAHGRPDHETWIPGQRPFLLVAWVFLGIGNVLGMVWAYQVLGWGGYWGWDPVENAAFLPWLTGTALVHTALAEERRGMLRRFSVLLAVLTAVLIVFGTFLTRSGIIDSVHAFAGATTGPYLLALLLAIGALGIGLLIRRWRALASRARLESLATREGLMLVAGILFVGAAIFVWVATMMPLFTEILADEKLTLRPPFFNRWMVPIGLAILGLLGLCTIIGWRGREGGGPSRWTIPSLAGLGTALIATLLGGVRPGLGPAMAFAPVIALGLVAAVGAAILLEVRRAVLAGGEGGPSGRRIGAQLVHLGVALMFIGFAGAGFTEENSASLAPGEQLTVAGHQVRLIGLRGDTDSAREAVFADLDVRGPDGFLGVFSPARFVYHSHPGQPTSEVAIDGDPARDLFLVLGEVDEDGGRAVIRAVVNPLVFWIWLGGALMVLGTVWALVRRRALLAWLELGAELREKLARPALGVAVVALAVFAAWLLRGPPAALVTLGAVLLALALLQLHTALRRLAGLGGGE
jgi:cytochrome c-type biogenesis protein CcmF